MKILVLILLLFSIDSIKSQESNLDLLESINFNSDCEIEFIENKGQLADKDGNPLKDVLFYARFTGKDLYFRQSGISYISFKYENLESGAEKDFNEISNNEHIKISSSRQDMDYVNSNYDSKLYGENTFDGYDNYYLSHCPNGILNVKRFKKIVYKNIYDNIDLVFYTSKYGELEYDYIVHPGGSPSEISISVENVKDLNINNSGDLIVETDFNIIQQTKPFSYQIKEGKQNKVESSFGLKGENLFSLNIGNYNNKQDLIIDPVTRDWGTYYGGTCNNSNSKGDMTSFDFDNSDNIVLYGAIYCGEGIATDGSYQSTLNGGRELFISKFSPDGTRLWTTYYGGKSNEYAGSLELGTNQNIYICGTTRSEDVLGVGGWQSDILGTDYNNFLASFDENGQRVWGTYYGRAKDCECEGFEYQVDFALDSDNNMFFCGRTDADDVYGDGGWQETKGFGLDAFLVKFDNNGQRLWGTYYGGNGEEIFVRVAVNSKGNPVLGGTTTSSDVIGVGGWQSNIAGGTNSKSGFISEFSSEGQRLWGTYFGGPEEDNLSGIGIGEDDNIYICGNAKSTNLGFGSYPGIHTDDGYVLYTGKFDSGGQRLWASYFGCGVPEDFENPVLSEQFIMGVKVLYNGTDAVYFGGHTTCENIFANGGFQNNLTSGFDLYISKFALNGTPIWDTYYGGNGDDLIYDLGFNKNLNQIVAVGSTTSPNIIGEGGFQEN
ncbi:hypothetical protein OAQ99_06360, partial [Candidatus Kapabacteria bacterium]|nr:hypothetical protein [Candidatus Kapabacteria bacterium]